MEVMSMSLQKNVKYTNDVGKQTLPLYRRIYILPQKVLLVVVLALMLFAGIYISIIGSNFKSLLLFSAVLIPAMVCMIIDKSDEKKYLTNVSINDGEKYWSTDRIIKFNDDNIQIYARYSNPDARYTARQLADEDFMTYVRECDADASERIFMLNKFRCYENESAFLLMRWSIHDALPLPKNWFTDDEISIIRKYFTERMPTRYTDFTKIK